MKKVIGLAVLPIVALFLIFAELLVWVGLAIQLIGAGLLDVTYSFSEWSNDIKEV